MACIGTDKSIRDRSAISSLLGVPVLPGSELLVPDTVGPLAIDVPILLVSKEHGLLRGVSLRSVLVVLLYVLSELSGEVSCTFLGAEASSPDQSSRPLSNGGPRLVSFLGSSDHLGLGVGCNSITAILSCGGGAVTSGGMDMGLLMGSRDLLRVENLSHRLDKFLRILHLGFERGLDVATVDHSVLTHDPEELVDHVSGMSSSMSNDIVQSCDQDVMLSHALDVAHFHLHVGLQKALDLVHPSIVTAMKFLHVGVHSVGELMGVKVTSEDLQDLS